MVNRLFSAAVFAGGLAVLGVTSAAAMGYGTRPSSAAETPTTTVTLADLDLTKARDVNTFLVRLDTAASQVCGIKSVRQIRRDLQIVATSEGSYSSCVKDVKDQAVTVVNMPIITAMYVSDPAAEGFAAAIRH